MELFSFVRLHAAEGKERAVEEALRAVLRASREEAGCMSIHAFRGTRDPRVFYIHSRWKNEETFELHATLPHTGRFLQQMEGLTDQPREVARTELID